MGDESATRRTCFATRTHYAGAKSQAAADVRLITILAVAEACRLLDRSTISHAEVACVAHLIGELWTAAMAPAKTTASWVKPVALGDRSLAFPFAQKGPGPDDADSSDASPDVESGDATPKVKRLRDGSSVDDSGSSGEVEKDAQVPELPIFGVYWFRQRSLIHMASEADTFVALCSGNSFAREPADFGETLESAREASGMWCKECLRKTPMEITDALVEGDDIP